MPEFKLGLDRGFVDFLTSLCVVFVVIDRGSVLWHGQSVTGIFEGQGNKLQVG